MVKMLSLKYLNHCSSIQQLLYYTLRSFLVNIFVIININLTQKVYNVFGGLRRFDAPRELSFLLRIEASKHRSIEASKHRSINDAIVALLRKFAEQRS